MQPSQRSRLLKFYSQGNAPQGGWKIQRGSCQRAPGVWDSPRAPRTTLERSSRRSAAIGARGGRGRARGARVGDFEASVGARGLGVAGAWPPLRGGRERPRGRVTSPWLRRRGESGAITKCKLGVQFGTYLQQSTALSDISSRTTACRGRSELDLVLRRRFSAPSTPPRDAHASRNVAELHTARSRACCAAPGRFTTAQPGFQTASRRRGCDSCARDDGRCWRALRRREPCQPA